jgi:hypothetical protein
MWPSQPPIQFLPGDVSLGEKQQRRQTDHSTPSSAEVNNSGVIPPLSHIPSWHSAEVHTKIQGQLYPFFSYSHYIIKVLKIKLLTLD